MPEVAQQDIDDLSAKLDMILELQRKIDKRLDGMQKQHEATSRALRRKGQIRT